MDDFAFQCCEISEGTQLAFCSLVVSGDIPVEVYRTLTGNRAAIRGGKKVFSAKTLPPLVLLSPRKGTWAGGCWIRTAEGVGSAHLPRRMGSDRFKLPIALLACCKSCVQPCVRGMGIHPNPARLCMWQVVFFNLGLVRRQTAWRRNWSQRRRKHCSTRNWEVFTCCSDFYALQRMNRESVRLHS